MAYFRCASMSILLAVLVLRAENVRGDIIPVCGNDYNDAVSNCMTNQGKGYQECPSGDCVGEDQKCFAVPPSMCDHGHDHDTPVSDVSIPDESASMVTISAPASDLTVAAASSSTKNVCGADYQSAAAMCNMECNVNTDCGPDKYCYAGVDCNAAQQGRPVAAQYVCGEDWQDAETNCASNKKCPSGVSTECENGATCFAGVTCGAAAGGASAEPGASGGVSTEPDADGVFRGNFCGSTYILAEELCKASCETDENCYAGETCFSGISCRKPTNAGKSANICGMDWTDVTENCATNEPCSAGNECDEGLTCYADVECVAPATTAAATATAPATTTTVATATTVATTTTTIAATTTAATTTTTETTQAATTTETQAATTTTTVDPSFYVCASTYTQAIDQCTNTARACPDGKCPGNQICYADVPCSATPPTATITTPTSVVCNMDVNLCPGGTYVGRNFDNRCQFHPCPTVKETTTTTTTTATTTTAQSSNFLANIAHEEGSHEEDSHEEDSHEEDSLAVPSISVCGGWYQDAEDNCADNTRACSNGVCPNNQICYASIRCPAAAAAPSAAATPVASPTVLSQTSFCGGWYDDAVTQCSWATNCQNTECPMGKTCYANIRCTVHPARPTQSPTPAIPTQNPITKPPTVNKNFCGPPKDGYAAASLSCGPTTACPGGYSDECPQNLICYAGIECENTQDESSSLMSGAFGNVGISKGAGPTAEDAARDPRDAQQSSLRPKYDIDSFYGMDASAGNVATVQFAVRWLAGSLFASIAMLIL